MTRAQTVPARVDASLAGNQQEIGPAASSAQRSAVTDPRVAIVKASYHDDEIASAVEGIAKSLGWADGARGAFGNVVKRGAKVVVKPNFVLHTNQNTGAGILPLLTHPSIIRAVVVEVLKANPTSVVVGDAPIQSCEFDELLRATDLAVWAKDLEMRDRRFTGIRDYRRTVCRIVDGVRFPDENLQPLEHYVLYNLGRDSLLEPVTDPEHPFRVTCYDPRLMARTHSRGHHQYLVAREVADADVVINLPKLKTHRKAGITNALKNVVGINGNKEFLPHHRVGPATSGGDCYPARDVVKRAWETVADWQNMARSSGTAKVLALVSTQIERAMRLSGDRIGVEGAWSGNQTVPRMTLDLNRILLYGRSDATLGETVQRRVVHLADAVIAGQGEGPLAPESLQLGLLLAGENAAAVDWIGAQLLGYNPDRIPLVRMALEAFRWRIADFPVETIELVGDSKHTLSTSRDGVLARRDEVKLPDGWQDARA